MKNGKYHFTFLYPILSYSRRVPLDLFYPQLLYPYPQIPIKREY